MVKMCHLCIGSVCIHGLLALSIGQYTQLSDQKISHSFSVRLLTSSKGIGENVNISSQKNSANRAQKKSAHVISQVTTENFASAPSVIYNPAPTYPVNAKANGEEGSFSVKLLVSSAGTVKHIEVITIKGDKAPFEEELLKTMKQWTFNVNGKEVSFEIPISFQLDQ